MKRFTAEKCSLVVRKKLHVFLLQRMILRSVQCHELHWTDNMASTCHYLMIWSCWSVRCTRMRRLYSWKLWRLSVIITWWLHRHITIIALLSKHFGNYLTQYNVSQNTFYNSTKSRNQAHVTFTRFFRQVTKKCSSAPAHDEGTSRNNKQ